MAEWTKASRSKRDIPKGIGGSNPSLSVFDYGDKKEDYSDKPKMRALPASSRFDKLLHANWNSYATLNIKICITLTLFHRFEINIHKVHSTL